MKKINAAAEKVLVSKPLLLGIYGDSFAASHADSNHFAWYNLLAEKLGGIVFNFDIHKEHQSYGSGSSPTFETYKKFKKYFQRHDINIMIVTDSWRFPSGIKTEKFGLVYPGYNNVIGYLENEKHNLTSQEIEIFEHLKNWYLVNDTEFMEVSQELMLKEIETSCHNVLLIPAGEATFNQERKNRSPIRFNMWEYHSIQYKELGIKKKIPLHQEERHDKISCHLTLESNTVLAELIYDYYAQRKTIELPTSIRHNHPWNYYYHDRN